MRTNQKGYVEDWLPGLLIILVIGLFISLFFVSFKLSNEIVSGIVYNTTNDRAISGATCFSVRAGENTPVTEENKSSYCLPPNSQYKDLVNRAAADKRIKVTVEAHKYGLTIKAPWTVVPNVTVVEIKQ